MPSTPADLLSAAYEDADRTIDLRRRLHRHPEIGLHLPRTQATVLEAFAELPLEVTMGTRTSSVVGVLRGARPGPTYLLRGDMDALPVQEDTGLPFASEVPGVMHACGHDTHVAMLVGAARLLSARRDELAGQVVFMVQPGEEGFHGARFMLEEGLLDVVPEAPVSGAFALHISSTFASGSVNVRPGPVMAAADQWSITLRGRGGHASEPHAAADPIPAAAEIVLALQSMITRRVDVFDPAVLTVAHLEAGSTNNVIPGSAFLEGTIRTLSAQRRADVVAALHRVAEHVAAAHDLGVDVHHEQGYPVTINDAGAAARVLETTRAMLGEQAAVLLPAPLMGAEDFSYVLQEVPGALAWLGARPPGVDPAGAPPNHSNLVVFDEEPLPAGVALYAQMALDALR
ncbi:amidohydrolase [Blastococcus sp. TML/M2B]|uniref:M20 metallopeptidase family protein n=1 Tax=unclassified Blastococcus TaxID=2619396 RepID=UPI00190E2870|nr:MULTISPECIES: M20 family metallopeptidase [unclassified Blastococcus]MBN1092241.1 amidohydrolase [Blastococcus sp. TML/M2B]MBN1097658.1 amidohydrolase [Blastococcus sp. TML/C7B]